MALFEKKWLSLVAVAAIALLAGFSGAWLHSKVTNPPTPPSLHDRLHEMSGLSDEQHQKLDTIEQAFRVQKLALEHDMRLANRELADAMTQDKAYTPKVQAAIDHFHHSMGALQKATIEHVFAMRAILTPAQQVTFDTQVRDTLVASSQNSDNGQQGR